MPLFANISFITPQILWFLLLLPALWLFFKAIPPQPKPLNLPTARFLQGIETENAANDELPWWLKLLRVVLFAFIIIAAAAPYIKPLEDLSIKGDALAIIFENSWAAAPHVEAQQDKVLSLIALAEQQKKNVIFIKTLADHEKQSRITLTTPSEARSIVERITLYPWKANHVTLTQDLKGNAEKLKTAKTFHWLGHGYDDGDLQSNINYLNTLGSVSYYKPEDKDGALLIKHALNADTKESHKIIQIDGAFSDNKKSLRVAAKDPFNNILSFVTLKDIRNNSNTDISALWDAVEMQDGSPNYLQVGLAKHAGAIQYISANIIKQRVGIAAADNTINREESPLIQSLYYLSKAVEGKAPYNISSIQSLIDWKATLIIIPENYALSTNDAGILEQWVSNGGTLLRFPPNANIKQHGKALMPVELLDDERNIAGRLDWQEPLTLGTIPQDSPLNGIPEDKNLEIKRQILAAPALSHAAQSWALASDATPLITARNQGSGRIILIHTQAKPGWSNLPLTGFFINMLHRIIDISTGTRIAVDRNTALSESLEGALFTPYKVINIHGELINPPSGLNAQPLKTIQSSPLSHDLWPGIYRSNNAEIIVNLGDKLQAIRTIYPQKLKAVIKPYLKERNINLLPYFIMLIMALILAEWLCIAILSGFTYRYKRKAQNLSALLLIVLFTAIFIAPHNAQAAGTDDEAQRANSLNLAYIKSNNLIIDSMAEKGLSYVANSLQKRTALHDVKVTGVNPAADQLAFYPVLYWPFTEGEHSPETYAALNKYINSGGMLFIDMRNGRKISQTLYNKNSALIKLGNHLAVPLLSPLPEGHVLRKSYYLLSKDNIAGRYTSGDIWLDIGNNADDTLPEDQQDSQYVARLLIGSNDWIGLWSDESADIYEREKALRFAINLIMYALTGTYKQDQVHTKAILERLEKREQQFRGRNE
tara:strand:+ start:138347 stop:141160 length:2814 start_codon:yes stop_codon:yes gene_type:complete